MRDAIKLLREQGRVQSVHAKGTYVTGDKTSAPVAPSRRLVQDLRDAITSGSLKPGDPLPLEQELMDRYGLAAITNTIALRKLREEGLIHHFPGRGRFAGPGPAQEPRSPYQPMKSYRSGPRLHLQPRDDRRRNRPYA